MCVCRVLELPIKQLTQPPRESRLRREADPTFVENLKQKMLGDSSALGATPMAILCKDVELTTEFNAKYMNVKFWVVCTHLNS